MGGDLVTPDWGQIAAVVIAATAAEEFVRRRVVKPVAEILDRSRHRDEDWNGVPSRPGVPGRPGVMAVLGEHSADLSTLKTFASEAAVRFARLDDEKELAHEEALKMWAAIEAVAKSRPPEPA